MSQTGYQRFKAMGLSFRKSTGWNSDIPLLNDEELEQKKTTAEEWLEKNKTSTQYTHYKIRYDAIVDEIHKRNEAKEADQFIQQAREAVL